MPNRSAAAMGEPASPVSTTQTVPGSALANQSATRCTKETSTASPTGREKLASTAGLPEVQMLSCGRCPSIVSTGIIQVPVSLPTTMPTTCPVASSSTAVPPKPGPSGSASAVRKSRTHSPPVCSGAAEPGVGPAADRAGREPEGAHELVLTERHAVQRGAEHAGFGAFQAQQGEIAVATAVGGHPAPFDNGGGAGHRLGQTHEVDTQSGTRTTGGFDDVRAREHVVLVEHRARPAHPAELVVQPDSPASSLPLEPHSADPTP